MKFSEKFTERGYKKIHKKYLFFFCFIILISVSKNMFKINQNIVLFLKKRIKKIKIWGTDRNFPHVCKYQSEEIEFFKSKLFPALVIVFAKNWKLREDINSWAIFIFLWFKLAGMWVKIWWKYNEIDGCKKKKRKKKRVILFKSSVKS